MTEGQQSSAQLKQHVQILSIVKLKTLHKLVKVEQQKEMVCRLYKTKVGKKSCGTVN